MPPLPITAEPRAKDSWVEWHRAVLHASHVLGCTTDAVLEMRVTDVAFALQRSDAQEDG